MLFFSLTSFYKKSVYGYFINNHSDICMFARFIPLSPTEFVMCNVYTSIELKLLDYFNSATIT